MCGAGVEVCRGACVCGAGVVVCRGACVCVWGHVCVREGVRVCAGWHTGAPSRTTRTKSPRSRAAPTKAGDAAPTRVRTLSKYDGETPQLRALVATPATEA